MFTFTAIKREIGLGMYVSTERLEISTADGLPLLMIWLWAPGSKYGSEGYSYDMHTVPAVLGPGIIDLQFDIGTLDQIIERYEPWPNTVSWDELQTALALGFGVEDLFEGKIPRRARPKEASDLIGLKLGDVLLCMWEELRGLVSESLGVEIEELRFTRRDLRTRTDDEYLEASRSWRRHFPQCCKPDES